MKKFFSFVGRYITLFIAALWLFLSISHLFLVENHGLVAALEGQLALAWIVIYGLENSS